MDSQEYIMQEMKGKKKLAKRHIMGKGPVAGVRMVR